MNPDVIKRFYKIKDAWHFKFHGVRLNRVMIFEMYKLANNEIIGTSNKWLKLACHTFDLSKLNFSSNNYILSTFGQQNRKDHKEVYEFVTSLLGNSVSYNDLNQLQRTRCIRPHLIVKVLFGSMWALRHCDCIDFKQKLRLSLLACVYCNALVDLEKLSLVGVQKYLSMYHADQLENMITQYMKMKHIPTYSLCEGVYIVDKENLTIDSVNYMNFETEHLLVWGQYVIDQFVKENIGRDKMIVCGYPHHVTLKKMRKSNELKSCLVLLARRDFMDANMRLLNILSHFSNKFTFHLKPHPNSDIQIITEFAQAHNMKMIPQTMTINECMYNDKFDWTIAVNTTAYYEALMRGIPSLRYNDGTYLLLPGINDDFQDQQQLENRIEYIMKNLDNGNYQNTVDKLLEYVMGIGINNYKSVLLETSR